MAMDGMVRERLNMYYLLDTSASMNGARIEQLNNCMASLKGVLADEAIENNVDLVIRAVQFGGISRKEIKWHTGTAATGISVENFTWTNLEANGKDTPTSAAIEEIANSITAEYLGKRALRPVVILITDGRCTDSDADYSAACDMLAKKSKGVITRIAIGVANADVSELEKFATKGIVGEQENTPFVFMAENAEEMKELIHWASMVSIGSSLQTHGDSNNTGDGGDTVALPEFI